MKYDTKSNAFTGRLMPGVLLLAWLLQTPWAYFSGMLCSSSSLPHAQTWSISSQHTAVLCLKKSRQDFKTFRVGHLSTNTLTILSSSITATIFTPWEKQSNPFWQSCCCVVGCHWHLGASHPLAAPCSVCLLFQARLGAVAGADPAPGEDVVPEPQDEVEENGKGFGTISLSPYQLLLKEWIPKLSVASVISVYLY